METKHTPGPWRFEPHDPQFSQWAGNIVGSYGRVNGIENVRTITCQTKYGEPDEIVANAHLIAAAPDLLEVCAELLAWAASVEGNTVSPNITLTHDSIFTRARAAIAKASPEGK